MKGMEEQTSARSSRSKRNKCGPVLSEWLTITRAVSEGKSGASGGRSLKSWAELKGAWAWASQRCGNKVKHGLITVRNRTSFSRGFWCCLRHGAQVLTSKCWLFYLWEDEWLQKWRWSHLSGKFTGKNSIPVFYLFYFQALVVKEGRRREIEQGMNSVRGREKLQYSVTKVGILVTSRTTFTAQVKML